MIGDLFNLLNQIPAWKQVSELPEKFKALELRITELETKAKTPLPPTCPFCFDGKQFMINNLPSPTSTPPFEEQFWKCQSQKCGKEDKKVVMLK